MYLDIVCWKGHWETRVETFDVLVKEISAQQNLECLSTEDEVSNIVSKLKHQVSDGVKGREKDLQVKSLVGH